MLVPSSPAHAFLPYPPADVPHASQGPLAGLTFAVKDIYDVAGYPTSSGNPHLLALSGIKSRHAAVVASLLDAGARFVGKTITDELAFSARGNNAHFGAPLNGAAPWRITGGSSSGSASAVSTGLADFALGSDTGGSVRAPANHCGLYGIRPTQDRISLEGCFPLCASFDTCGFMTRDAATFARVAAVLLGDDATPLPAQPRLLFARDLFALLDPQVADALKPALGVIEAAYGPAEPVDVCNGKIADLYHAYRVLQGREAWQAAGELIEGTGLRLGPDLAARFAFSKAVTAEQADAQAAVRHAFTAYVTELLGHDGVVIMPTMPDIAPLLNTENDAFEAYRNRATHLLGLTPLCGMPQISLPFASRHGAPLGISLMGPHGSDRSLVELVTKLTPPGITLDPDTVPPGARGDPASLSETLSRYSAVLNGAALNPMDAVDVSHASIQTSVATGVAANRLLGWQVANQSFSSVLRAEALASKELPR
jgi:amidase